MRILLVTQYFLPEPHRLLAELATTLAGLGNTVGVMTGFPHWPQGKVYPGYRQRPFRTEEIDGITIYRFPIYPDHSNSPLKRACNVLSLAFSGLLIGPWVLPRFDVIHVVSPPLMMIPAWFLSRLWRVPFTYEVQDMWPETLSSVGMLRNPVLLSILDLFLRFMYRRAACIRVISPGFKRNLRKKGVPEESIFEISNWTDTDVYRPLAPDPALARQPCLRGKFNVMFAGNIGLAQELESVLRAAQRLSDLPDVRFVMVGDGVDLARLQTIKDHEHIDNVTFLGRFPPAEMPGLLALADVLLVHLSDDPLFRITIPHKTIAYLAAGRPILAAVTGDVADLVLKAKAGIVCKPGNPASIADAVRMLYSMPRSNLEEFGVNGRNAACTAYSRTALVARVDAMLRSVSRAAEPLRDSPQFREVPGHYSEEVPDDISSARQQPVPVIDHRRW